MSHPRPQVRPAPVVHSPLGQMFQALGTVAGVVLERQPMTMTRMKPGSSPLSACTPCGASQRIESANRAFGLTKEPVRAPRTRTRKASPR